MSFLGDWQYRKKLTVTGTVDGTLTDYCVGIKVYYGAGVDGTESGKAVTLGKVYTDSKCKTDFGDIRFTEDDGVTELGYWMEEKTDSNFAIFWVQISSIPISPTTVDIYVYYGNDPMSTTSDGDATFLVFDHFTGAALDTGKWDETLAGNTRLVEDSYLKVWIDAAASYHINSTLAYDFPDNAEVMTRMDMKAIEANTGYLTVQVGRFIDRNAVVIAPGIGWYAEGSFDRRVYGVSSAWWAGGGRGCATGVSRHAVSTIRDDVVRHFCEGVKNFGPETFTDSGNFPTSPDRYIRWLLSGRNVIQGWLDWIAVRPRSPTEPLPTSWSAEEENPVASLKAIFHVGQDSRDLFATFGVKQWQEDLKAITNIVQWESLKAVMNIVQWESLLASFHVGQNSRDLKGIFVVRHSSSAELLGTVIINQVAQLKAIFIVRHSASGPEFFAKFEVGQDSVNLKAVFRTTQEVLFAKALITRPGSATLFSTFIVRQPAATNLFAKFELAQWKDLYCTFRVRKILNFEGSLGIGFKWWGAGGWDQMIDFEMWTPTGSFIASFPDGPAAWRWIFLTFKDMPGSTAVLEERGIDGSRPDKSEVAGIFWTYHSEGIRRVDSIYIWRAAELKAIFIVRNVNTANLFAEFEIQDSEDLKAEFISAQWYADLKAVFSAGIVETKDLKAVFEVNHFDFFGPWTVLSSNPENVAYPHQEKVFRWPVNGRHWIFYVQPDYNNLASGPNYYYMFWKTSADGENWSSEGIIPTQGVWGGAVGSVASSPRSGLEGRQFSAWVTDDGVVHIAVSTSDGFAGNDLWYKRGAMAADGSISWSTGVTAVYISSTRHCKWATICCDADGYPYITWYEQTQIGGQGQYQDAFIVRSITKDGTWTQDTDYYYAGRNIGRLSSNTQIRYMAKPVPLDNGKVFAFFGGDAEQEPWWPAIQYDSEEFFRGRQCDGDGMGGQEITAIGSPWQLFYGGAAINVGNDVIAAVMCEDLIIRICKWSDGNWGTPQEIQAVPLNTTPIFFKIPGHTYPTYTTNDKVVIVWIDEATDEVRYKVSSDDGDIWHPGGNANYCVLMQYPTGFGTGGSYQTEYWGKHGYYTIHSFSMRYGADHMEDVIGFAFNNTADALMFGYIKRSDEIQSP